MQGECIYKIISIRKRHPIFICKAIQINQHTEPLMPPNHPRDSPFSPFSHPPHSSFNQGHTPFPQPAYSPSHQAHNHHHPLHPKEKSHQLSSPRVPPKQRDCLPSHSTSCDLKKQVKVSPSSGQLDSKSKQLKSIKEYLRLAYKRN